MSKKLFVLLVVLMSLSLTGIIFVQAYHINNTVKNEEEQFTYKVKRVLSTTSTAIEEREYKEYALKFRELMAKKGVKVEMEHTNDESIAKEISMDHLFEDPNYYTKLKKVEATEATSSDSSGQYSTPAFVAKDSKNWRTNKKTQIPGGKFVKIKDKCKKFPYCNQGDINALKIFENKSVKKVIKIICKKYDVSENVVKSIIVHEYESKILNKQNMKHLQLFEDFVNKAKSINEATQTFKFSLPDTYDLSWVVEDLHKCYESKFN